MNLAKRVAHLEAQIQHLTITQRRLQSVQTLLQMSETFKLLNRKVITTSNDVLKRHRIRNDDIVMIDDICKARNEAAHPTTEPDLTYVDKKIRKLFTKVQNLVRDEQNKHS